MVDPVAYVANVQPTMLEQRTGIAIPVIVRSFVLNYLFEKKTRWNHMGLDRRRGVIEQMIVLEMRDQGLDPEKYSDIETYWANKNPKPMG